MSRAIRPDEVRVNTSGISIGMDLFNEATKHMEYDVYAKVSYPVTGGVAVTFTESHYDRPVGRAKSGNYVVVHQEMQTRLGSYKGTVTGKRVSCLSE